jgi:hypothetical protein
MLPLISLLAFISAPIVIGSAEQGNSKSDTKDVAKTGDEKDGKAPESKTDAAGSDIAKDSSAGEPSAREGQRKKGSSECLASEEVVQDLELREAKMK